MDSRPSVLSASLKANLLVFVVLAILWALGIFPVSWLQSMQTDPFSLAGIFSFASLALLVLLAKKTRVNTREQEQHIPWTDLLVVPLLLVNTAGIQGIITLLTPLVVDPFRASMDNALIPARLWILDNSLVIMGYALAPVLTMLILFFLASKKESRSTWLNTLILALVLGTSISWAADLLAPTVGPANFDSAFSDTNIYQDKNTEIESSQLSSSPLSVATPRDASPALPLLWMALSLTVAFLKARKLFWSMVPLALIATACGILAGRFYLLDLLTTPVLAAVVWSLVRVYQRQTTEALGKEIWLNTIIIISAALAMAFGLALIAKTSMLSGPLIIGFVLILSIVIVRSAFKITHGQAKNTLDTISDIPQKAKAGTTSPIKSVLVLFFFSGVTGLVYEVIFERELALIFGSMARSTTTVLAVYMAGLALGSALGGKLSDRVRHPLRYYALVEGLVGIVCLFAPSLFGLANQLYLGLVHDSNLSATNMELLQVLCGALVVVFPAMLMGTTMPLLAKYTTDEMGAVKRNIAFLYSANTLGAATGTILAAYYLIWTMGIEGSLRLTSLINFSIAAVGLWLSKREKKKFHSPTARSKKTPMSLGGSYGLVLIICAGVVGFTTFGLEVLYVHLLAVVAGNSIYAFGLMLFAFLLGLGLGSSWIGRMKFSEQNRRPILAASIVTLGMLVLVLLPLWDRIPPFLGLYSQVDFAQSFVQREFIRLSVCVGMMIIPTFIIGMIFPQMVALSTKSIDAIGRHVGLVSFSNTLGDILGAVVVGLVFLPLIGSYRTTQVLGMSAVVLGAILLLWEHKRSKWFWSTGSVLAGIILVSLEGGWNMNSLTAGTNVYFRYQPYGEVVEYKESVDGGISSIARAYRGTRTVTTMLTDGKFQGDDHEEMLAQCRFAFYPLLHCQGRNNALLIGLGTGVTGGVLLASGFKSLQVAELSADIADLAHRYFSDVNGHVLDDPRTDLFITDGRNLLLLGKQKYDLISIEITCIWFAGAANMYNREFYELAREHLAQGGVLQQWIQLHHISPSDVASILATIRSVFPHVSLYFGGHQGVLVASMMPLKMDRSYIDGELNGSEDLKWYKSLMGSQGFDPLIDELLLSDSQIDEFVRFVSDCAGLRPEDLISTDSNRRLEYSSPRGNVRPHGMRQMALLLSKFRK